MKVLVSYHYYSRVNLETELDKFATRPTAVFGDSGAFSAFTQEAVIDVDLYAEWVRRWFPGWLTWYANLDVIGSPEGTWRNQMILEKRHGLSPLPVFHFGEPWAFLDQYLDRGYPYICLGGMVGQSTPRVLRWAAQCFKRAQDGGHDTVFHGFGQTKRQIVDVLPWYSVDSSSWGQGARYGQATLWNPETLRLTQILIAGGKTARWGRDLELFRLGRLTRDHGFDPSVLADPERFHHSMISEVNCVAYLRFEAWLRAKYAVPFPGEAHVPGPHLYLASGSFDSLIAGSVGAAKYEQSLAERA